MPAFAARRTAETEESAAGVVEDQDRSVAGDGSVDQIVLPVSVVVMRIDANAIAQLAARAAAASASALKKGLSCDGTRMTMSGRWSAARQPASMASRPKTKRNSQCVSSARPSLVGSAANKDRHQPGLHAHLKLIHGDGEHDHNALDHDLPELRNAHHHQTVGEDADDEGADQRAAIDRGRPSARCRRARRRRWHSARSFRRSPGCAASKLRGDDEADQACAEAGEDVGENLDLLHADAGEPRGALVAANGIDMAAEGRAPCNYRSKLQQ